MAERFYIGDIAPQPGERVRLSAEESQHLVKVMRAPVGARVVLFGGSRQYEGTLCEADKREAVIEIAAQTESIPEPRLKVRSVMPWLKGGRTEMLLQKLTEIGVSHFAIYNAVHDVAKLDPAKQPKLQRVIIEACKQCGRSFVPSISLYSDLNKAIIQAGPIAVFHEKASERLDENFITECASADVLQLVTGPEGGLADKEVESIAGTANVISLGPRILRAETAPLVVASIALAIAGDL